MSTNYDEIFEKNFNKIRSQQAYVEDEDASRKSSIDSRIIPLVKEINDSQDFFTTSSCSGRFIAYAQNEVHVKKNCEWIRVTHDPLTSDEMERFIEAIEANQIDGKQIFLKFEPFILHVCCRSLNHAKAMLDQSTASGYRNSGISFGSSKIILAVRSTQNLEMPVSESGKLIIDRNYLSNVLIHRINDKFKENFDRIEKFYLNLKQECLSKPLEKISLKNVKKAEKAQLRLQKQSYYNENRDKLINKNKETCLITGENDLENELSDNFLSFE